MKNNINTTRPCFLYGIAFATLLMISLTLPQVNGGYQQLIAAESTEGTGMERIQLILKKLRSTMASMKDFDELEEAGMPTSQVNRMRKAMTQKVQQLTDDAVSSIRDL